jgi:PIN domain nuclease of toxin-antitoxin system
MLLLDTHAFAWAVTEPNRLSQHARYLVSSRETEVYVSAATAWELSTKYRTGRWPQVEILVRQYERIRAEFGVRELAISSEHALLAGSLDWHHRDPFDRVLAAQAMREGLALVTKDDAFRTLPGVICEW